MIDLHRRAGEEGWSLLLANPQQQVVRLLQISGIDQHLTIVADAPARRDGMSLADPALDDQARLARPCSGRADRRPCCAGSRRR